MKSSITNCNSNDQLLQLVLIQLLHKAYFRQLMFEGANYFTIPSFAELGFLLLMSIYIMRYLLNGTSVSEARLIFGFQQEKYVSSSFQPVLKSFSVSIHLQTGNIHQHEPQCAARCSTGCYFCSSITGFRERLFSVCGLLTKGTRNRMEKFLYMRVWLKVNFDELSDILQSVDWLDLIS